MEPSTTPVQPLKRVTFVLGNVHPRIGGPTQTILGYSLGLNKLNVEVTITGVGTTQILHEVFGDAAEFARVEALNGSLPLRLAALVRLLWGSANSGPVVLVGVWHLPFFALGLLSLTQKLLRISSRQSLHLIPTMSLVEYDWAKRKKLKRALRPVVRVILAGLDSVIFASSGESRLSSPRSWRKSAVILHPSRATAEPGSLSRGDRPIDLLFVGRLAPQKDLPLLIDALARCESRPRLAIVGTGDREYVEELRSLAVTKGCADQIDWMGWRPHHEAMSLLGQAKIVPVTSISENFCHAAAEALIAGCELVMVERVMSALDFSSLGQIRVVPAEPTPISVAIDELLGDWSSGTERRAKTSESVTRTCTPTSPASSLLRMMAASYKNS